MLPVDALPRTAELVNRPEQLIDTIVLRNLELFSREWFGLDSRFLFHSTDYWGPFDIGCILSDGAAVAFENKSNSVARSALDKFWRDIATVSADVEGYYKRRFEHVVQYHSEYIRVAERMFAGFFLGKRCDTVPSSRDLSADAGALLGLSREQFIAQFKRGVGWLDAVGARNTLPAYLNEFATAAGFSRLVPILFVPENCLSRLAKWLASCPTTAAAPWWLASYQFFTNGAPYPQWLSVAPPRMM